MKSVYDNPVDFTDRANPYIASGDFNTSAQRRSTSPILAELIQMSCIDTLDELRDVPAAKLGDFPFDQKEALARLKRWTTATPLERLTLQRQWTEEFRQEYVR
jgi:hypothetical protein